MCCLTTLPFKLFFNQCMLLIYPGIWFFYFSHMCVLIYTKIMLKCTYIFMSLYLVISQIIFSNSAREINTFISLLQVRVSYVNFLLHFSISILSTLPWSASAITAVKGKFHSDFQAIRRGQKILRHFSSSPLASGGCFRAKVYYSFQAAFSV